MVVWAAWMTDSSYGKFRLVFVAYDKTVGGVTHWEYHWYTTNLVAGQAYAKLVTKAYPPPQDVYDVNEVVLATIYMSSASEDKLTVTVTVGGVKLFTAQFSADTSKPTESRIEPASIPQEQFLSVEARRPMLTASVKLIPVGTYGGGWFKYIDTELYDASLLA